MSNNLIKRLHNVRLEGVQELCWEAADRIEELKESNKELTLQLLATSGQAADALEKLANAVEIGNKMAKSIMVNHYIPSVVAEWNAALIELEGGEEAAGTAWRGRE
jgi:hypothetical protein